MESRHQMDLTFKANTNGKVFKVFCKCAPRKDGFLGEATDLEQIHFIYLKHVMEADEEDAERTKE